MRGDPYKKRRKGLLLVKPLAKIETKGFPDKSETKGLLWVETLTKSEEMGSYG